MFQKKMRVLIGFLTVLCLIGVGSIVRQEYGKWKMQSAIETLQTETVIKQQEETAKAVSDSEELLGKELPNTIVMAANQPKAVAEEQKRLEEEEARRKEEEQKQQEITASSGIVLDQESLGILERIVEAEATGEDLKGKILVANVVLNRVVNECFPDTVKDVVFQKSGSHVQFSPTADGRFETVTVSEETKKAVKSALAGEDYSMGALFFSARSKADPTNMSWFDTNLKWLFAYGGHEFYTFK